MSIGLITFLQVFAAFLLVFGVQTVTILAVDKHYKDLDEKDKQRHRNLLKSNGFGA
jgi:hypothetical protein